MASKFVFSGGAFDELPPRAPEPPPSPEEVEANDARVNDLKNLFIAAKQNLLFSGPQAFLRQQGADAIAGAGDAGGALVELRRRTLDQAANTPQRARLAEMLDWHLADATDEIHRHVAQQSTVWQQDVAACTVALATTQAALEAGDAEKVGFLALAAHDAERARALKAGLPPEAADGSARIAWSGAYRAAIDAQAVGDPPQAVTLFKQAQYTLDPQTRDSLAPRMEALSRDAQAGVLADKASAIGADRKALLEDPAVPPEVRQLAESRIADRETAAAANRKSQIDTLDRRLGSGTPQALASGAYVPGTYAAIADGYAAAGDAEKTAGTRHLAANEALLTGFATATPANQALTLVRLEPGAVRDQALRIKDATDRLLADDPLRWGTTVQRANGVGELAPLDLLPSPTNMPQAIAAALARREQQARQSEALSGRPTLAMTRAEIAAFKTALDAAPLESKQKMLRGLAGGLGESATARLALELAQQGPLADGYAIALSTYGARRAGQDALADRILDGLSRMKAAGEGGKPVADTGPEWRRAFDEKIASVLPHLDEKNAAAVRTATAALYAQSMALRGKGGRGADSDEVNSAIQDLLGASVERVRPVAKTTSAEPELLVSPATLSEPTGDAVPADESAIINFGDGTKAVMRKGMETPHGKVDLSTVYDQKNRLISMIATFADGHRVESRWSYAGKARLSQVDVVRDAKDETLATITTTFDGERFTRITEPLNGPPQTESWDENGPIPTVQKVFLPAAAFAAEYVISAIEILIVGKAIGDTVERSRVANAPATPESSSGAPAPNFVPLVWDMRIATSVDAGKTVTFGEATKEEVMANCPNFAEYEEIARRHSTELKAAGMLNGREFGGLVHRLTASVLKQISLSPFNTELMSRGLEFMAPEYAILNGVPQTLFSRGRAIPDVLELHRDNKTVCVFDFKTGDATFPDAKMIQYAKEAGLLAFAKGYTHIFVVPIRVP